MPRGTAWAHRYYDTRFPHEVLSTGFIYRPNIRRVQKQKILGVKVKKVLREKELGTSA